MSKNVYVFPDITILSYNVAGLLNKFNYSNFFSYLSNYDIVLLYETFITENNTKYFDVVFNNFEIKWKYATKGSIFGRASEGSVYAINLNSKIKNNIEFVEIQDVILIKITLPNFNLFIIPTYINCNNWLNDFKKLQDFFQENINNGAGYILIGDMNVRIGNLQSINEEILIQNEKIKINRMSKDMIINKKGKIFLDFLEDNDLYILNGRTDGDLDGNYTFIGPMGCSVNDICCVTANCLPFVTNFEVEEQIFSDHLPISLKLGERIESKSLCLLPKFKLNKSYEPVFVRMVEHFSNAWSDLIIEDVNEAIAWVIQTIKQALGIYNVDRNNLTQNYTKILFKNKWFDGECQKLRKQSFSLLNLFKKTNSTLIKSHYLVINNKYKELCKLKKKNYRIKLLNSLTSAKSPSEFWEIINSLKGRKYRIGIQVGLSDLFLYFKSMLNREEQAVTIMYAEPCIKVCLLDKEISISELLTVIAKTKNNKAPGLDRVSYEFYKKAPSIFLEKIVLIFNKILNSGLVPKCFAQSIIFPLFKKGDSNVVQNYRGISFYNCIAKLFTGILINRLDIWVEEHQLISEYQAGFRRGYSTVDHIYTLLDIIQIKLAKKRGKLYAFFVDFEAAFDSIDRKALFYKLAGLGMSTKIINVLKSLYKDTSSVVWDGKGLSESFVTQVGLKQGCLLSPRLFSLFIEDLSEALEGGGVQIGTERIKLLMYADDLVLLSENPIILQKMISNLETYCYTWNLKVNLGKSKIKIFKNKGRKPVGQERWFYRDEEIEIVPHYKYLGININSLGTVSYHLKQKITSAKHGFNYMFNNLLTENKIYFSDKWKFFNSVCRSTLCYAAQVWGFKEFKEVEQFQIFALKKLLALPLNTPNYMLFLETGLSPLHCYTFYLHINYIIKTLQMTNNRLPNRITKHAIANKNFWCREWIRLATEFNKTLDFENIECLQTQMYDIVKLLEANRKQIFINRALNSSFHSVYSKLNFNSIPSYLENCTVNIVSTLFKTRGGLLNLNYQPWVEFRISECSLCNRKETEDIFHFLGCCPVLSEFRRRFLCKPFLDTQECLDFLNGKDWVALYKYIRLAMRYRYELIKEFNFD